MLSWHSGSLLKALTDLFPNLELDHSRILENFKLFNLYPSVRCVGGDCSNSGGGDFNSDSGGECGSCDCGGGDCGSGDCGHGDCSDDGDYDSADDAL